MTINERIRKLRKEHLRMNQTDFASLIGMKQTSVSSIEKIGATVTDQTIMSICFAVDSLSEDWLRNGTEPMFREPETFSLEEFMRSRGATDLEYEIIRTYFELDSDTRQTLIDHFRSHFLNRPDIAHTQPEPTIEQTLPDPAIEQVRQNQLEKKGGERIEEERVDWTAEF